MRASMYALLIPLLCLSSASISCQTAGPPPGSDSPARAPFAAKKAEAASMAWRHEIVVVNAGTKSEGIRERLYWMGVELPPVFEEIRAFGYVYTFVEGKYPWSRSGYRYAGRAEGTSDSGPGLSEIDLARGWVASPLTIRRPGTPSYWIAAKRGSEEYWLDPAKAAELARTLGLASFSFSFY